MTSFLVVSRFGIFRSSVRFGLPIFDLTNFLFFTIDISHLFLMWDAVFLCVFDLEVSR